MGTFKTWIESLDRRGFLKSVVGGAAAAALPGVGTSAEFHAAIAIPPANSLSGDDLYDLPCKVTFSSSGNTATDVKNVIQDLSGGKLERQVHRSTRDLLKDGNIVYKWTPHVGNVPIAAGLRNWQVVGKHINYNKGEGVLALKIRMEYFDAKTRQRIVDIEDRK